MDRFNVLVATFVSAALLATSPAKAMEIPQFDKMAQDDRAEYISELVQGAEKVLTDEGKTDRAEQVANLFRTNAPGANFSIGMAEFMRNLALLRLNDAENHQKNPNDPRIEVEDAMAVTLKNNHIPLPDSFYTVASNFRPKYPLQKQ